MQQCQVCSQLLHVKVRSRTARFARMALVSFLLLIILYQSSRYSVSESSDQDIPDLHDDSAREQKLRLRVKLRPTLKATRKAKISLNPKYEPTQEQMESMSQPIQIAIMTAHYFGHDYGRHLDNCSIHGVPLNCSFTPISGQPYYGDQNADAALADAVWWHGPNTCLLPGGPWHREASSNYSPFKARADQWAVIASMESSAYYPCLEKEDFMSNFDIKMTYQRDSQVPLLYWSERYKSQWEETPPLSFEEKEDAVVFLNSNCDAPSGRTRIVQALREQPGIRVDALGLCLNGSSLMRGPEAKYNAFRRYRYCIAIENSLAKDYVTEKIYDALAAGCLPIYLGAPNIEDFIPSMEGIIDYKAFGSAEKLAIELQRLSANKSAYSQKFAWQKQLETWSEGFANMRAKSLGGVHTQCQLCQVIALDRANLPAQANGRLRKNLSPAKDGSPSWEEAARSHVANIKIHYKNDNEARNSSSFSDS